MAERPETLAGTAAPAGAHRANRETAAAEATPARTAGTPLEVLGVFTRLGLTSFGGPVAHLGYYRAEIVQRRGWVDEPTYADLVALCQFLPGPASSQVGISLGITRAGLLGGLAAWIGFTMPSALLMIAFAYGVAALGSAEAGWLHGLKVVAVAVVAQAVWGMARSLCPDRPRATLAILAAIVALLWPTGAGQIVVIVAAGLLGWQLLPGQVSAEAAPLRVPIGRPLAIACWVVLGALLVLLPLLRQVVPSQPLALFDSFFRSGSLVFGGGHVVLPLLQAEVVPPGWVSDERFLAGYGAAQAVPGPLFTVAAYLGAAMGPSPNGWVGGLLCLVAVFLPSALLVVGALPFWDALRVRPDFQAALRGINAGVVGLLLAALYQPVWTSAILGPLDFCLGLAAFGLLAIWRQPPWLVVLLSAIGGFALSRV
ncbi:MAG: chromate efflux transporter [Chloroflexi bacterium]|nr:chromate efflux transporter [Chloroflexota bacterium]